MVGEDVSNRTVGRSAGFTLVEMLIVITVVSLVLAVGASALRTYRETAIVREAARVVASDIAVVRSEAIKHRGNVSLVATEPELSYVIRDGEGDVLRPLRTFGTESDLPLHKLDIRFEGDSVTFNSRGVLVSGGTGEIDVGRADRTLRIEFNALGRHRIVEPDS